MNRVVNTYSNVSVKTNTNKADILLQLYEGAIRFVDLAKAHMTQKDMSKKGEYISRVIAIITELDSALDRKNGNEIVENLSSLYSYMIQRLTQAGIVNDPAFLSEVRDLLATLLDAWQEALKRLLPKENQHAGAVADRSEEYGGVCIAL